MAHMTNVPTPLLIAWLNSLPPARCAAQGMDPTQQAEIDRCMIALDGTDNKARLGANAIVGVSMAVARVRPQCCCCCLSEELMGPGGCSAA